MTACGAPDCKNPDAIQQAVVKIMGTHGMATAAMGFGGVVAAATAALGAGLDPTSTAMAAMAGATASVMGGFIPKQRKRAFLNPIISSAYKIPTISSSCLQHPRQTG